MLAILFLCAAIPDLAIAEQDVDLGPLAVGAGEVQTYAAEKSITAHDMVVRAGAQATLRAGAYIRLLPGFQAEHGSNVSIAIGYAGGDVALPVLLDGYPPESSSGLVGSQGRPFTLLYVFGDNGSGGAVSAQLLDADGQAVSDVTVTANTLEYHIENPASGDYFFTLQLTDASGNEFRKEIRFHLDTVIPETTVDIAGQVLSEPVTVHLECSEDAKIYYSTDGYPPYVGASNTMELDVAAEIQGPGISINRTTRMQFFAVDPAGNIEPTQSEVYLFDNIVGKVSNLSGLYDVSSQGINLSWSPVAPSGGYRVYRCLGAIDCRILDESRMGGYPAPARLLISSVTNPSFSDVDIVPGISYRYGVAARSSEDGADGIVSELVSISVPEGGGEPVSIVEAITRAKVWLAANQQASGAWGAASGQQILATSQALLALKAAQVESAGVRDGLFFLRGHYADNNDFLARSLNALAASGQNVDQHVTNLVSRASIFGASVLGWGMQKRYMFDALDTALAITSLEKYHRPLKDSEGAGLLNSALENLPFMQSSIASRYGWVAGGDPSVYVSALVYATKKDPAAEFAWVVATQTADGGFGDSITDTAAVLLWLDLSNAGDARSKGAQFLITQQAANGSWNQDPYVTALCLEALLKE